ncbi:MAG: hypothetical protein RLZZ227_1153 [Pseudomonadota bacterium]|jgi:hypothetical protein
MAIAALLRHSTLRGTVVAAFALASLPALAGSEPTDAPWSAQARVDRLLWSLINDERYSHLQIAANYERLRARLLDEACLVSTAPCLRGLERPSSAQSMTTEITPEQQAVFDQLLYALRHASAAHSEAPVHMMVSTTE